MRSFLISTADLTPALRSPGASPTAVKFDSAHKSDILTLVVSRAVGSYPGSFIRIALELGVLMCC
jgi:hypothetical protein